MSDIFRGTADPEVYYYTSGTLNSLHGTIETEIGKLNNSNEKRLERFGCDLKIYISETLAVYYCRYYYLDIYLFVK
jgi:hypothetical protein